MSPQGTCYLAFDSMAAILEVIGPDRLGGVLSTSFAVRRLWERPQAQRISTS
jgi:hypothetical protein